MACEWKRFVRLPAREGGLGAEIFTDLDAGIQRVKAEAEEEFGAMPGMYDYSAAALASEDLQGIRLFVRRKARKRRATPPWALPCEVWHMLLWPNYRATQRHEGLGASPGSRASPVFWRRLQEFLAHMRVVKRAPTIWNISRSWDLDKKNGRGGPAGRRIVHGFCLFGKAWTGAALARGAGPALHPSA